MSGSEFRVLLVGAGEQGWESRGPSVRALAEEGVVLAAIADPNPRQLEWTARRLGVERTYPDMTAALEHEQFDGVVLAVPTRLHEPLTLKALEAGLHVLAEKPMAEDTAGGRRMLEAAERAGKVLAVGYQFPWMHSGFAELANAGELAGVFRVDGHWTRVRGIPPQRQFWPHGAGGDLLGHLLSVVLVGVRRSPLWASAFAWDRFGRQAYGDEFTGHDTVEAMVCFEGGVTAHLLVAWDTNETSIEVPDLTEMFGGVTENAAKESIGTFFHGPELSVAVPLVGRALNVSDFKPIVSRRIGESRVVGRIEDPLPVQTEQTFVLQARNWISACRDGEELLFSAEDALRVQEILGAVGASIRRGGGHQVPVGA